MYDFIFTWPQSEECLQIRVVICNSFFLIYLCNSELLMKPLAKRPNESRKYLIIFFLSNGIFDIFKIKIYSGNIYIYIYILPLIKILRMSIIPWFSFVFLRYQMFVFQLNFTKLSILNDIIFILVLKLIIFILFSSFISLINKSGNDFLNSNIVFAFKSLNMTWYMVGPLIRSME